MDYIYDKNPAIVVALLAKMSKVEGKVITKDLSKFISSLLDKIDIFYAKDYEGFRETYAKIFIIEKNNGRSINELCSSMCIYRKEEADFLICLLLDLIYYDKKITPAQNALMENIIIALGLNLIAFREIKLRYEQISRFNQENERENERENYQEQRRQEFDISLEQAYEILQSKENDSFESIKKNYRRLAKEYHYDSLHSKDLPPELLKIAQEMMKKINLAYEIIKEARGI
nr:DnaJ domain-containing protein [Campylobacter sp. US33a]